ncbi:MAG: PEP/pyruvate-binding domain-containing protein [Archangium sp.]
MSALESELAGGKANGLARLVEAGAKVPRAMALDAAAFDEHVARAGTTREQIIAAPLAAGILKKLDVPFPVAVRSSALDEDGGDASFAGQHDSVLNVTTREGLEAAIKQCWASAFSERAIAYRAHVGAKAPRMGVVIQSFVEPRAAGVVFTQSPSGKANTLVIEAVKGRGEELVSGRAVPERFELARDGIAASGGSCVSLEEVRTLAREALELEAKLGGEPLDLEWAIAGDGALYWLQARPITTALSQDDSNLVWSNTNAGELLPDVATPMTLELVRGIVSSLFSVFTADLGIDWDKTPVVGLVGGRIYFSMNAFSALAATVPGMSKRSPAEFFGGHADEIMAGLKRVNASKEPLVRGAGFSLLKGVLRLLWRMFRQRNVEPKDVATIYAETERLSRFDVRGASDEALLEHLHVLNGGLGTQFHDVFAAIAVGMGCTNGLMANCKKWLGDADGSKASALLAGLGELDSAESALELWKLGEAIRAEGVVLRDWPSLRDELATRPALEQKWKAWMARHGHHARAELDVAQPRWRETPEVVVGLLLAQVPSSQPGPLVVFEAARVRRERVEREALEKLGPIDRAAFRFLLSRARRGTRLRENLKSESVRRLAMVREVLLELGERLTKRNVLSRADDVFFLQLQDLKPALAPNAPSLQRRVARARAEHRKWTPLTPPPVVVGRLDPTTALPPPVPDATVLKGLAVSGGILEGIARVVLRSDQETKVAPGEVLVAPFTDPGWAPYFVAAGALVVDLGGMLSHGSIIAREYGIPAVVNVGHGTRRIKSGSRIRVDGFRGEVTILSEP